MWRRPGRGHVGIQLALEHRAHVDEPIAVFLEAGDVGDERPAQTSGQRWSEVAGLVGVRQEHERRLLLRDQR